LDHRGVGELADAEADVGVLPVEEAPDDGLGLLADRLVDLGGREDPLLHQEGAVALPGVLPFAHRLLELLGGEDGAALEEGAEAVLAVVRGGVDDVAFLDVDLLDDPLAARPDEAWGLATGDTVEDIRERRA